MQEAIEKCLEQVMTNEKSSLTDKMKVIDRFLKMEQIRLKIDDEDWGSGFRDVTD